MRSEQTYTAEIEGEKVVFAEQDIIIITSEKEGYAGAASGALSVVLDTQLTSELVVEFYCREFVSKVQAMRKAGGFDIVERIDISIDGEKEIVDLLLSNKDKILSDILVKNFTAKKGVKGEQIDLEGKPLTVCLQKNQKNRSVL